MLHHSGNSTRFDYITRAFKAGHYLKSRRLYLISEQHAAIIVIVLALSRYRRGQRLDPVSAKSGGRYFHLLWSCTSTG